MHQNTGSVGGTGRKHLTFMKRATYLRAMVRTSGFVKVCQVDTQATGKVSLQQPFGVNLARQENDVCLL